MTTILTTFKKEYIAVPVTKDAYRFTLVKNKNMKNRYGKLEFTERINGTEHSIRINNIENVEIVGALFGLNSETVYDILLKKNSNTIIDRLLKSYDNFVLLEFTNS